MYALDTNFLMIPHNFGVDVLTELTRLNPSAETVTVPAVMDELRALATAGRGRDNLAAEVGLKLVDLGVAVLPFTAPGSTDDILVALSQEEGAVVCTQDKELKQRLAELRRPVVVLRNRSHLEEVSA
ncbi:MAG: hypothetical protein QF415_10815 [Candidatus Undinarchaeales archaeon]|nr:hypothetical protein [Candidatus Undinarchaeales archaeon]MDP7491591.1 hypothetical protein [Candidatus Undinarchaeales archaeon]